ncbi:type ISP restriction/modification enzyme [Teredinibacter turnerae]|uniref:type ISP restriction/modification enzyme n=1 Tax=Teredinibacter turnerae TaxID=2426 RepID=UPI003B847683
MYHTPTLFPEGRRKNFTLCVPGAGCRKPFSSFISAHVPDYEVLEKGQGFPMYFYETLKKAEKWLIRIN